MDLIEQLLDFLKDFFDHIPAYTGFTTFCVFSIIFLSAFRRIVKNYFYSKINIKQKTVLSIIISLILYVITSSVADQVGSGHTYSSGHYGGPFNWDKTYFLWLGFLSLVGVFNFLLFED